MALSHRQLKEEAARFVRQYGSQPRRGMDPNDRNYSRSVEALVKRMDPVALDALLHGDDEDEDAASA